ncbi:RagB/SusD family nutrient uptake outer membrane protein [Pedobacter sp. FW305-3-2-15-E-R2A2]|uniref:RagB/SusD family nutrient uptake outer membrane protein n=1 Tax=Pedobacter sp. FW305-3-2-15-E-R2A2 TaxID=3140251 RepID=UPI0031409CF7
MRTFKIISPIFLLCLLLLSCQKYVDIQKSSNQTFLNTANDCQLLLDNYTVMNSDYPTDLEISADDYYTSAASYLAEAQPVITSEEQALYSWQSSAIRAKANANWLKPYLITSNANLVLEALAKIKEGTEDPVKLNTLRGSALFYRAYTLWFVAQMYAKPYSAATAAQDPGVPIRLTSDINEKSSRGTVQDTYNQIISDLSEAVNLLPPTSSIATRPNKAAAYAMLARTYLSMEDYPKALINANAAIQIKGELLNYNSGAVNIYAFFSPFQRYNKEVIFHSISALTGILTPGIGFTSTAKIDLALAASYNANDIRKIIFVKPNSGAHAGSFRFGANYEPTFGTSVLFNGLAVDELYITRAECYARAGDKDNAMADLNKLLVNRWVTGTYTDQTAATADEALTKVLEERRKELLMRGLRWTDLRRLNKDNARKKDLSRSITKNGVTTTFTLPANDPRYVLLIPQNVIDNSSIAQNPR